MQDMGEGSNPTFEKSGGFPRTVTAAGIVWIVIGSGILINFLVLVLLMFGLASDDPPENRGVFLAARIVGGLFVGVVGAFFLYEGIETVRGKAPDTLANGSGSILLALIAIGYTLQQNGAVGATQRGEGIIAGIGLFAAGVLALMGRSKYEAWRRAQKTKSDAPLRP
jgi:hypothetical protein